MNHKQQIEAGARAIAPDDWKLADAPSFAHLPSAAREGLISKSSKQARAAWAAFHPTITTRAEFDALPYGSIVMDEIGCAMRKTLAGWLVDSADLNLSTSDLIATSTIATVLHYGSDTP